MLLINHLYLRMSKNKLLFIVQQNIVGFEITTRKNTKTLNVF